MSKSKTICFIANFYKTFYFNEIANILKTYNYNIYWIVTKEEQYKYLKELYEENSILLINKSYCTIDSSPIDDFKINELIFGDRVFKYTKKIGYKFLTNIQQPIYDFLFKNKIETIIGETTWAHELLIHRIISLKKELKCKYYILGITRIPNGRFLFFDDEKNINIVKLLKSNSNRNKITDLKIEKPDFLLLNERILKSAKSLKGILFRIKKLLTNENIERNDPNVLSRNIYRLLIPFQEEFNRFTYRFVKKNNLEKIIHEKYILFGFHKQPESSIDVCGRYFEDQTTVVINLWRQLPNNWKLVIKEHTSAVGDRSYLFYRKFSKYPNIILVDEKIDSHILIRNSQIVATNTGTMALEAALLGIPSITLSKVFFNAHNYCRNITWSYLENFSSIIKLRNEIINQNDNSKDYINYIIDNSFEGFIGDIDSDPSVVNPNNIEKVARAVMQIIDQR